MDKAAYLRNIESNARTYAATFERVFHTGRGVRVWNTDGDEYLDCLSNAGALPLGHNHPEVREAVLRFIASDHIQQALDLATPAKCDFVEELFAHLPEDLRSTAKIQFCGPTGSDANEAAMKLTRLFTNRPTIIAFHGAYHGMTSGALGAMGNLLPKSGPGFGAGHVHFAPFPYRFRCPFGTHGEETERLCLNYLRTILADPEAGVPKPAAIMMELVQGEGGCIPASDDWLRSVRALATEHGIPLIVDEVQTGLGRTGRMFACEHSGITPDVLVLSKAIGGGYPLSVVIYDRRLDVWSRGMHAGTFRGNQIAMVAGRATMQIIKRDGLADNATKMGNLLLEGLRAIARRFPSIGDIRGKGLMLGMEIVKPTDDGSTPPPDAGLAKSIRQKCFENGLIVELGGRQGAVLRLLPPLTIGNSDVGAVLDRLESSIAVVSRAR